MQWVSLPLGSELTEVQAHLERCPADAPLTIWLSKPLAVRQQYAAQWRTRWFNVQVYGAYKPLVAWVAEQLLAGWQQRPPQRVRLLYPVLAGLHPERFLLESYPLAGWLRDLGSEWVAEGIGVDPSGPLAYTLYADEVAYHVAIPARWATDLLGERVLRPTSRLQVADQHYDILSDTERVWDAYAALLPTLPLAQQPPFFGRLTIEAALCAPDDPLPHYHAGYDHETLSLQEGLAEDFYFGTLEYLQARAGWAGGSRTLQPGQIVPLVRPLGPQQEPQLQVRVEPLPPASLPRPEPLPHLAVLGRPLRLGELSTLVGRYSDQAAGQFESVQGRPVWALRRCDADGVQRGGMLLSAGQHANETTGVAAAARFWTEYTGPVTKPLAYLPLENPDGYALHAELCGLFPEHMHHAARYTALGDDLEYRPTPTYEKAARAAVGEGARLHLNLHGYPAHEWTRPMSGYAPRHFEAWALPKGFFILLRYQPAKAAAAHALAQAVTLALAQHPTLLAYNSRQRAVYEAHTAARPYELLHGTPTVLEAREAATYPITLITEFPDETVYGDLFRLGVEAQLSVIQAAWQWLNTGGA